MKIFFDASFSGKKEFGEDYRLIFEQLKKDGHQIVASPVMEAEAEDQLKKGVRAAGNFYLQLITAMKKADVVVLEVTYPSTRIGHEIALALQYSKPVVALHLKDMAKNPLITSITNEKLQLTEYTKDSMQETLEDTLQYANDQADTRFNFFISPEIGAYMDWVAKEKKLPRAVFLRQLIEKDMSKQGYEK
jgi:hypothetical protein